MSYLRGCRAKHRGHRPAVRADDTVSEALDVAYKAPRHPAKINPETYDTDVAKLAGLTEYEHERLIEYMVLCALKGYSVRKTAALIKLKLGR